MKKQPPKIWQPTKRFIENSNITAYLKWLEEKQGLHFEDYQTLWQWSVDNVETFWKSIWDYYEVITHSPYHFVMSDDKMPDTRWFGNAKINYAEHIFRHMHLTSPAIVFKSERHPVIEFSWNELFQQVASMSLYLKEIGVKSGDRVAAFLPNIPEATMAFLATISIGGIWSSCSPDFGTSSVVERFRQIEPKVLFVVDGYQYNGKPYDKTEVIKEIIDQLPSVEKVIFIPYLNPSAAPDDIPNAITWNETFSGPVRRMRFEAVPFDHPIWILYSSGTTGQPKAITHSHGGVLLEHLKYLGLQNDVKTGERFFWFSTTGWMMWNFVQAALLVGGTIVLYDGSPGYPDLNTLWEFTETAKIDHFGTSAPYLVACMKKELTPGKDFNISHLRSISSTGSPLPPEAFAWVRKHIKENLWLCSMSGGTDVCTAFVGGNPMDPVYQGEIQGRALGCELYAYNDAGQPVTGEVGEMVIVKPMPSMPVFFWNDKDKKRYKASYFSHFPNVWRHGDWVEITERNTLIIYGRSDATLNRHGVRIGTSEIYRSIDKITEIEDSLIVNLELKGGNHYMPLFVKMAAGKSLTEAVKDKIKTTLRADYSPRHVPDEVIEVDDIPYTISGKKMEAPVKKILLGFPVEKAANVDAMKNPESLAFFVKFKAGKDW